MCDLLQSNSHRKLHTATREPSGPRSFPRSRGEFRPRQTRQLPRAVDLKERLLSCQSY